MAGGDSNVYELTWTGSTWQQVSIGNAGSSGVKVQSIPAKARSDNLVRIYASAADGGVYEYTWTGSVWQTMSLGLATAYMYGLAAGDGLNNGSTQVYGASYDGNAYLFEWMPAAPPPVAVPNVVGLQKALAITTIVNNGLTLGTVTNEFSTTVPADSVISQNPAAGTLLSPGSAVALVVSSGPPSVQVPSVVGLPQAAATTAIVNSGLTLGSLTSASSTTVPVGSVISQDPVAGTPVPSGSLVNLVVSSGVTVPNVVGQPQSAVAGVLGSVGLIVGTVTRQSSATVPIDVVISQVPSADAQASGGSTVNLVVSSGPPPAGPTVDRVLFSDGSGTRTISVSTSGLGEVLLAFAGSDGPSTGSAQTLTVSGGGLTWTLVRRANTRAGTSEIWRATAAAQLSGAVVSSTQSRTGYHQSLTVVAVASASGTGASAIANGATGAPSVALTTTKAGSLVYGVGNDWDRAVARTLGAGQTMVHEWVDTSIGDTFWVQAWTGIVASAGVSIRLNDTAPTNDRWNFASVEIVP